MDHMHDYDGCMDVALYLKSRGCGGDEDKPRFLCAACRRGRLGVVKELVEQDKVDPRSECDNVLCLSVIYCLFYRCKGLLELDPSPQPMLQGTQRHSTVLGGEGQL